MSHTGTTGLSLHPDHLVANWFVYSPSVAVMGLCCHHSWRARPKWNPGVFDVTGKAVQALEVNIMMSNLNLHSRGKRELSCTLVCFLNQISKGVG